MASRCRPSAAAGVLMAVMALRLAPLYTSPGFWLSTTTQSPTAGADVLATGLRSCRFLYTANQGATQQSGFVSVQLELTRSSETASLVFGAHVANTP